jgi:hypothetical protein
MLVFLGFADYGLLTPCVERTYLPGGFSPKNHGKWGGGASDDSKSGLYCRQMSIMSQQLWIKMANLVFELEKKLQPQQTSTAVLRSVERMKAVIGEAGLLLVNPAGESYSETRTDLEASIAGPVSGKLVVMDVIKPIVYSSEEGRRNLVQRGVVIVGQK